MKIVIVGCGKTGKTILECLVNEKHDVVAVDNDKNVITEINNAYDVMCICGNGTEYERLKEAGADKCELFIACTDSDIVNMLSCFVAKKMGARHTVARIRDLENNDESLEFMKKQLDLSLSINPELLTAHALYNILKLPSATKVETFSSRRLEMIEIVLKSDSQLDGIALKDLRKKQKSNFLVCAVGRGDQMYIPKGDFVLKGGDRIGLIVAESDLTKVFDTFDIAHRQIKDVMILGAGITSVYLAKLLLSAHISVKLIEQNKEVCEEVCETLPSNAIVIHGNGMSQDLLLEEGVDSADAFVALTGKDEENIIISYYAMSQKVNKVIAKVNTDELTTLADKLGLDCLVTPRKIVADIIVKYARALKYSVDSQIETLYSLMNGMAEAVEFKVLPDFEYTNIPLKDIKFNPDVLVAGIIHGQHAVIPNGDDKILPDDKVIVIVAGQHINRLSDIIAK